MRKQSFKEWFAKVNAHVLKSLGISAQDLPDCPYQDWYEGGVSPSAAAKKAIRNMSE